MITDDDERMQTLTNCVSLTVYLYIMSCEPLIKMINEKTHFVGQLPITNYLTVN